MSILIGNIMRIALQVLAGVGVGELMDKFVKPKVPEYYTENISPGFKPGKLIWFIAAFVFAFMILKWVGRKLKIKLLR